MENNKCSMLDEIIGWFELLPPELPGLLTSWIPKKFRFRCFSASLR
jgi:hypothetical protein